MPPNLIALPRGGRWVQTSAGPIQFGIPPETIKDSMALGVDVPTHYVVPREPFDRRRGINVAECEFPAYYNFFILKRRIRLLVADGALEARVRTVFQESLFGPTRLPSDGEFAPEFPAAARPMFRREGDYFRSSEGGRLSLEALVEFVRPDAHGVARIGTDVEVAFLADGGHVVRDHGVEVARVPARIELPERRSFALDGPRAAFEPPRFGVTVLGASHGFDPTGRTTGFVLWIGGRGVLVDPPVDATETLREQGVPAKLIDGVIVTHCHADHDSGAFQKLLEEGRVKLYTTPTILGSFLRKYSALSGISEDLLRRTFEFRPFSVGAPMRVHGAEIYCFYNLHSIPAIGIEVFYGGKSLAISGDSLYDPGQLRALRMRGILSRERCEDLLDFPWQHTVILHEAGVPPLHTPVGVLADLPDDVKQRLYLVHIAERDVPEGRGLRAAAVGLANTIRIEVARAPQAEAIEVLEAFCAVDLFRDFGIERAGEILHVAHMAAFAAGERIIAQGARGDKFYVLATGQVAVVQGGRELKRYQAGDYFGETALVLGQPRSADVVALTEVRVLEVDRFDFLYLLRGTDIAPRLVRLARIRNERSWEVLERNTVIRGFTSAQKTQLQSFLKARPVRAGDAIWEAGGAASAAFVVDEGQVLLERDGRALAPFCSGALLGEFDALQEGTTLQTTARAATDGRLLQIGGDDLRRFLRENPGVMVSFLGTVFVE